MWLIEFIDANGGGPTLGCLTVGKLSGVVRERGRPASKTALMISVGVQIIETRANGG